MDNCDLGCTLFAAVPNAGLLRTADSLISITDQRAPAPRTKATLHAAQELADRALLAVMLYTISHRSKEAHGAAVAGRPLSQSGTQDEVLLHLDPEVNRTERTSSPHSGMLLIGYRQSPSHEFFNAATEVYGNVSSISALRGNSAKLCPCNCATKPVRQSTLVPGEQSPCGLIWGNPGKPKKRINKPIITSVPIPLLAFLSVGDVTRNLKLTTTPPTSKRTNSGVG